MISRRERFPLLPCSGGLLVQALADAQLKLLLQHLCKRCTRVGKKVERRDIATIALKTVLEQISDGGQAAILVDVVMPSLITGIDTKVQALQSDTSMPQSPPAVSSQFAAGVIILTPDRAQKRSCTRGVFKHPEADCDRGTSPGDTLACTTGGQQQHAAELLPNY